MAECGGPEHTLTRVPGFQLLATVLSQKPVSESSPGDSPAKLAEGSAGEGKGTAALAAGGAVLDSPNPAPSTALTYLGAARPQPPVAHTGPVYAEQPPKKLEPASEGKVRALSRPQGRLWERPGPLSDGCPGATWGP